MERDRMISIGCDMRMRVGLVGQGYMVYGWPTRIHSAATQLLKKDHHAI